MSRLDLTQYDVSMKTGFILENPLTKLPGYFDPWNNLASKVSQLVASKAFRDEVLKLPVLDHSKLNGPNEVKLGHLQLSMMASGYLWQDGMDNSSVPQSLPQCLAVPLFGIFEKHGIPPFITYADIQLNNGVLKNPGGGYSVDNIAAIIDVPADKAQWDWFFGCSYLTEYEFGKAMPALQDVLDGVDAGDDGKIASGCNQLAEAVKAVQAATAKIQEKLTTDSFFPKMTVFFGFGEVGLKNGSLVYEGVKNDPIKVKGANASQTPIFKVLDALLGVEHPKERQDNVEAIMQMMQPAHRKLVQDLKARPKQLKAVAGGTDAFKNLVAAVNGWRSYHIQIVTKYVVQGLNSAPGPIQDELKPIKEPAMKFVQGMRDDTK